ncbi:MAG: hypothetical protein AB7N73_15020 [Gemmatimonadales bacterium]
MPYVTFSPGSFPGVSTVGTFDRIAGRVSHSATLLPSTAVGNQRVDNYKALATAGTYRLAERHGRYCIQHTVSGAGVQGSGWRPPDWTPPFDPTLLQSGMLIDPGAVVLVLNWHVSAVLAGATPGWGNDTSPMFFLPLVSTVNVGTSVIGGAGPHLGGFGVFLNNVAGAAAYEYVAWASGSPGTVLERVTVPVSSVPSVANWNTFRFIIIAASAGRRARLTVQANGIDVVADREMGGAFLQIPTVAAADAMGMIACWAQRGAVGDSMFFAMDARTGRFTPAGVEVQVQ